MTYDAYNKSYAAKKLRKFPFFASLDLDGTFNFAKPHQGDAWQRELLARKKVREYIEAHGVLGTITLRRPSMILSKHAFEKTRSFGYPEPEAHLGTDAHGKRIWQDPQTLPELSHVLDWDVIGCVGSGILVRSNDEQGVYCLDTEYHASLGGGNVWRTETMNLLKSIDRQGDMLRHMAPIEDEKNYLEGVTDVAPTPFRIQFNFAGSEGLKQKHELMDRIIDVRLRGELPLLLAARNVVFLDESKPDESTFTVYLLHKHAKKEQKLDHMMKGLSFASSVPIKDMELLIAGDTMTDLRAGIFGGGKAKATFILVGGSRMAPYIVGDKVGHEFAGESLKWFTRLLNNRRSPGVYEIKVPLRGQRTVIIGDVAFPGTYGPETILAWIESRQK
jgi:hypothetical protein